MGPRNRPHNHKRQKPRAARSQPEMLRAAPIVAERKPPVVYGKPFVVLEDSQKDTFVYQGGQWVRHSRSIAECREDCQVKELAQKINAMTRYEICSPVA